MFDGVELEVLRVDRILSVECKCICITELGLICNEFDLAGNTVLGINFERRIVW